MSDFQGWLSAQTRGTLIRKSVEMWSSIGERHKSSMLPNNKARGETRHARRCASKGISKQAWKLPGN
jgi:hypothetical protein